jgi:2-(1,2-epoxy-1,2-dihydrophenyl)acetyl-CoA isomerase
MGYETIAFEVSAGVATLTLNRPDRLNSFTVQMHEEVRDALDQVEARDDIRVLLLTGAGRGFCAGQDLSDRAVAPGEAPVDLGDSVERYYNPLVRRLVALPMPVICAVNGVAAGAGANIALAADIVIAKESARFIQSFANIGLIPDSGGAWILPRLIGQARALAITLTGDPVPAAQAEAWGMIWRAAPDEAFQAETAALVARFAAAPTLGLAATKALIRQSGSHTLDEALDLQRDTMSRLGRSADYAEGVAAFLTKRQPVFLGR